MTTNHTKAELRKSILEAAWRRFDGQDGETYFAVCNRMGLSNGTHWKLYSTLAFADPNVVHTRADFEQLARAEFIRMDMVDFIRGNITHFTYRIGATPSTNPIDANAVRSHSRYVGFVELNQSVRIEIDTGFILVQQGKFLGDIITNATREGIVKLGEFDGVCELLDFIYRNQQCDYRWQYATTELIRLFEDAGVIVDPGSNNT